MAPSIIFSKNFTRFRRKCDSSGAAIIFSFNQICWQLSTDSNLSFFVCDCIKALFMFY